LKRRLKPETLLSELEDVARRLYGELRRDEGFFVTGLCTVHGQTLLVVNTRQPVAERIAALAGLIARSEPDRLYLKPAVREEVERHLLPEYVRVDLKESNGT